MAAGCSGSKSTGGGTPPTASASATATSTSGATSTPTAGSSTATPFSLNTATPVPAATAAPTGLVNTVNTRPLANGDVFRYAGTTTQSFVYMGVTPNPSYTSSSSVTQIVNVSTPKTYAGVTGLSDFVTTETDTSSNQTYAITTNSYFGLTTGPTNPNTDVVQQALTNYGYTSTDSFGENDAVVLTSPGYVASSATSGTGNGTVDLVPEENSPTWTNSQAQTFTQTESDGFSATRTYAADGTYVENDVYPQTSAASPAPTPTALTAKLTENSDGSGQYDLPLFQQNGQPNVDINFSAPTSAGLITITFTDQGDTTVQDTEQASAWFAQPITLYKEIDRDNGAVKYPSTCNVNASLGTTGNQVEQKFTRTDTILGTLEFFDQLTYVASNGVAACVQLNDVTYIYYDYSGQSNPNAAVAFSGGNSPYETQTVATTLGVSSNPTVNSIARGSEAQAARAISASAVANARANFLHTVDHYRAQRERTMYAHFRARLARLHR